MRQRFVWLVAGCLLWHGAVQAQEAQQVLERLQQASVQNYQGKFIYERKDVFSTHQMWHLLDQDSLVRERFLQLNGPRYELFRSGDETGCLLLDKTGESYPEPQLLQRWSQGGLKWPDLSQWYSLQWLGRSRVADRQADVVLFAPRDAHRYPLELHVDVATGVPLKSLLLNEHGQLLERFQFVGFSSGTVDESDVYFTREACRQSASEPAWQQNAQTWNWSWLLDWVPEGFEPLRPDAEAVQGQSNQLSRQGFSDGVAQFSVFVEPLVQQSVAPARWQLGPTAVVARRLDTEQGAYMITVLGELPAGTVERLSLSVRIQEQ